MEPTEGALFGFLSGIGLDEVMRQVAIQIPALQQPSPLPLPGYDPAGVHYDDLITLIASLGLAAGGYVKKNKGLMAAGLTMALGSYLASVIFTPAVAPTPPPTVPLVKGVYVD